MSASCQANPLQQFLNKGDRAHAHSHARGSGLNSGFASSPQQHPSMEQAFLNEQHTHAPVGNRFLQVQQPSPLLPSESTSSAWLNQFSTMKLEDPLEFSKDYQDLYANYESQQMQQTRQRVSNMSPTLQRTIYRQPMGSYFNVPRSEISIAATPMTDAYFHDEFETLERELEEASDEIVEGSSEKISSSVSSFSFDHEQLEFQKIASSIVDSCSSVSNSPSPVSSKLSGSKFMSLMRGISEGSVSLNRNNDAHSTEFRSSTGEIIGNEFSPVMDHTHDSQ